MFYKNKFFFIASFVNSMIFDIIIYFYWWSAIINENNLGWSDLHLALTNIKWPHSPIMYASCQPTYSLFLSIKSLN